MGGWAEPQKMGWGEEQFPGTLMITCKSAEKSKYCEPGDVIIDDWPKYSHLWMAAGGHFILHESASKSLSKLELLVGRAVGWSKQ